MDSLEAGVIGNVFVAPPIPEPATALMIGVGLAALSLARRRKR